MPEPRRRDTAEQPRQTDLPACRRQQINTANHVGDELQMIVYRHRELIRPVAESIAHQQIAALQVGILFLRAKQLIEETLGTGIHAHAPADAIGQGDVFLATRVWIEFAVNLCPRACASVDQLAIDQRLQGLSIDRIAFALADQGPVVNKAEPREIVEDRLFVFGLRSLSIVILDPQQDASVATVRRAPDMQGIDDVPEVKMTGRSRRKPCQHLPFRIARAPFEGPMRPLAAFT